MADQPGDAVVLGTVIALWRYPVKSMGGEALTAADVGWHGLAGDRRWAFVQPGLERSGFPWLTLRERAEMRDFVPRFAEPQRPDDSPTFVRTPDGEELEIVDPRLAARLGEGVRLIKREVGLFDAFPLSLITTRTLAGLQSLAKRPLEPERFRPNLLVEPHAGEEFPEDGWVGATLRVGSLRMRLDVRDPRCVIVTMDPGSGERDPGVLRQIARARQGCAGVYGSVVEPGRVAVGDTVVREV